MAITRTDINGDITALKVALETLVPDFFASVEFDDTTTPTAINCKDADNNTVFTVTKNSSGFSYNVFKDASTSVSATSTDTYSQPLYFYKVGDNGAAIQCRRNSALIVIAKTNTGVSGFALPNGFGSTLTANLATVQIACLGDDPMLTSPLTITTSTSSSQMTGNHTMFVQIPMHGTYEQSIYLLKAFFLPMAQDGMRGAVQELSTDSGTYLTNGYVALLDDSAVN